MTVSRMAAAGGFTVAELLIATAITFTITLALLEVVDRARASFEAQPEHSDMHQRLRIAVDALTRDLMQAGAGVDPLVAAPVMPYRVGAFDNDPDLGVFYRSDAVTVLYVPAGESNVVSHTYYADNDYGAGTFELMRYDGASTDLPIVDHVVALRFDYFGDGPVPLDPGSLQDGPWRPDSPGVPMFDADLLQIRRIRVLLRVQAALNSMRGPAGVLFAHAGTSTSAERYLPDLQVSFDIALRNGASPDE